MKRGEIKFSEEGETQGSLGADNLLEFLGHKEKSCLKSSLTLLPSFRGRKEKNGKGGRFSAAEEEGKQRAEEGGGAVSFFHAGERDRFHFEKEKGKGG